MTNTKIIAFEGLDGCGKGTQIKLFDAYLQEKGYKTLCIAEPYSANFDLFEKFNFKDLDKYEQTLLFMLARHRIHNTLVARAIDHVDYILTDRSVWSTHAYQNLNYWEIFDVHKFINYWYPGLVFYLDISIDTYFARKGVSEVAIPQSIERTRQMYLSFCEQSVSHSDFVKIDGNETIQTVSKAIIEQFEMRENNE